MKKFATVFALIAMMGVSACESTGTYTSGEPVAQGRTAGHQTVGEMPKVKKKAAKADMAYSKTMAK